jgi:hypothetical protein
MNVKHLVEKSKTPGLLVERRRRTAGGRRWSTRAALKSCSGSNARQKQREVPNDACRGCILCDGEWGTGCLHIGVTEAPAILQQLGHRLIRAAKLDGWTIDGYSS